MLVWTTHKSKVRCLAFSPDGKVLASAPERASSVPLWDPTSGTKLGELRGRWGATSGIAFSADGKLVATTTMDFRLVIWDAETRTALSAPDAHPSRYGPAFAPDGSCVVASGQDGAAVWHDPVTPHPDTLGPYAGDKWEPDEELAFETAGGFDTFDSVAFSPDGRLLAAQGLHSARVYDTKAKKVKRRIHHASETDTRTALAFSPDGARLALGFDKNAEIHPVAAKGRVVKLRGHTRVVRAVGFTPDGRTAMTAASDGTVRSWDARTGKQLRVFDWGVGALYGAAFSPDGLLCAAGGEKGQIVVWDVDA